MLETVLLWMFTVEVFECPPRCKPREHSRWRKTGRCFRTAINLVCVVRNAGGTPFNRKSFQLKVNKNFSQRVTTDKKIVFVGYFAATKLWWSDDRHHDGCHLCMKKYEVDDQDSISPLRSNQLTLLTIYSTVKSAGLPLEWIFKLTSAVFLAVTSAWLFPAVSQLAGSY